MAMKKESIDDLRKGADPKTVFDSATAGYRISRIGHVVFAWLAVTTALCGTALGATPQRHADVAARGPDVMPFRLAATTHVFTKTATGGTQRVISKDPSDATQTALVRQHLHEIKSQFESGNFSGPSHIHGADMPGLTALKAAKPGDIRIAYRDVDGAPS